MAKVDLDAIIPREDFEIINNTNGPSGKKKDTISIEDLKPDSFFFTTIRKPDFQRETNEWDESKIHEFIKSFIEGDLIPAIILWRSNSGLIFVIDGSHRLSSIAAWISDDYGDGKISKMFYDGEIPEEQINTAEKTRKLINSTLGSYDDYKLALTHPNKVDEKIVERSKNLAALAIQLQWVEGDVNKAENSFYKINQQAAPINNTELKLIKSRRQPNSIAARAIIRAGKGHKYWSKFDVKNQNSIQRLAEEIFKILFYPKLETPIKTLDLPMAGKEYAAAALSLVLNFVNIANKINQELDDDILGDQTISILKRTLKVAQTINSNHPGSLGLHPIIYFYSKEGTHRTATFYAITSFVVELETRKKFNIFLKHRYTLENIIWNSDYLIQQINRKYRESITSYIHIAGFILECLNILDNTKGITSDQVINKVTSMDKYKYLKVEEFKNTETSQKNFNTGSKNFIYINSSIKTAPRCKICNGLLHKNSISIDHIQRKEDGGLGNIDNGQLTHPYCNTGFKN